MALWFVVAALVLIAILLMIGLVRFWSLPDVQPAQSQAPQRSSPGRELLRAHLVRRALTKEKDGRA